MLLRIVNYADGAGGVPRFITELLGAMASLAEGWEFEVVSHGPALSTMRSVLKAAQIEARLRDLRPGRYWRNVKVRRILGVPGTWRLARAAGFGTKYDYDVPPEVFKGCDGVWFPFLHLHRLPPLNGVPVIGTFHDTIAIEFAGVHPDEASQIERDLAQRNLKMPIRMVVSSKATADSLARLFGAQTGRINVIPVPSENPSVPRQGRIPEDWRWASAPFLFCASSFSPHKNHRALFDGFARWERHRHHPLVLTGVGVDLSRQVGGYAGALRDHASGTGLRIGTSETDDVIARGYVSDEVYAGLLERAWALVMPSLMEGGGSFPVAEAIARGIPVLCSDIPVMREQLERLNAEALWFDPRDPSDIARALAELESNYPRYAERAAAQVSGLSARSWSDAAAEYWRVISPRTASPSRKPCPPHAIVECREMNGRLRGSLAEFFAALTANGDGRYFHPHPLTEEQTRWLKDYTGRDYYCVLVEDGSVAGYGMLRGWDEGYEVPSLGIALHPAARRRGLARLLMEHLHSVARARAARRIRLKTYPENRKALALYKELGYRFANSERAEIIGFLEI